MHAKPVFGYLIEATVTSKLEAAEDNASVNYFEMLTYLSYSPCLAGMASTAV